MNKITPIRYTIILENNIIDSKGALVSKTNKLVNDSKPSNK